MKEFRLVIWGMHGIYAAGKTMDETFGLIETVEKAAQIFMLTAHLPRINTIQDAELARLAEAWRRLPQGFPEPVIRRSAQLKQQTNADQEK